MTSPGTVLLVHGFLRSGLSMTPPARALKRAGFEVIGGSLWTLGSTLSEVSETLAGRVDRLRQEGRIEGPLHFLTHSMGGVVVRHLVHHHSVPEAGRALMIPPPNQGAEVARRWRDRLRLPWGDFDPLTKLVPEEGCVAGLPTRCSHLDIGVIAGGRGDDRGLWPPLEGDNDGTVRVEEMHLPGAPTLQIRAQHTAIIWNSGVLQQAVYFLQNGQFDPSGPGTLLQGRAPPDGDPRPGGPPRADPT